MVECQAKSAKKSVRFAAVLCKEEPESYTAGQNGRVFYPAPPQRDKPTGTLTHTQSTKLVCVVQKSDQLQPFSTRCHVVKHACLTTTPMSATATFDPKIFVHVFGSLPFYITVLG